VAERREAHEVYFGDASDPEFIESCGLAEEAGVIITINDREAIDFIVSHIRSMRPEIPIVHGPTMLNTRAIFTRSVRRRLFPKPLRRACSFLRQRC